MELRVIIVEARCNLEINHSRNRVDKNSIETLDLKCVDDKKDRSETIPLHQEHPLNDVSRRASQRVLMDTCGPACRDF